MPLNGSQLSRALAAHAQNIEPLIERYEALAATLDQQISRVAQQAGDARFELARLVLPDLDPATLVRVERMAGFSAFRKRDPATAMAQEQAKLVKLITRLEQDERFQRREYLVGPVGEHTRALEEAYSLLQPWELDCQKFEKIDGFMELIETGYDTPAYTISWLEGRYWRLWAAGDKVCSELGLGDFGDDVLPAWRHAVTQRDQWRRQVGLVEGKIGEVHELVKDHDQATHRLNNLPAIFLEEAQRALAQHLGRADLGLVSQWVAAEAPDDRALTLAIRRAAGLGAKSSYLSDLKEQGAQARLGELKRQQNKYQRKAEKFARPKYAAHSFADIAAEPELEQRLTRLEAERETVGRMADAILAYDAYDRFALDNPPDLWWWEMTGKRPPRALPELRSWYERNPNLAPARTPDDRDALGAAASSATGPESAADFLS